MGQADNVNIIINLSVSCHIASTLLCLMVAAQAITANGLSCYKCQSLELDSKNEVVKHALENLHNVRHLACETGDGDSLTTVTCPEVGEEVGMTSHYTCGLLRGKAEAFVKDNDVIDVGKCKRFSQRRSINLPELVVYTQQRAVFKIKGGRASLFILSLYCTPFTAVVTSRDCMLVSKETTHGCQTYEGGVEAATAALHDVHRHINVVSVRVFTADVCFCSEEACDAAQCPSFYTRLSILGERGICVTVWLFVCGAIIMALVIFGGTSFCLCRNMHH